MEVLKHVNPALAELVPYEPGRPIEEVAREMGLNPDEIIKLASNESALGPSPKAVRAMKQAISEMHLYPDGGSYELRSRLADLYDVTREQVITGNGSNELLEFIGHCFMRPGKSVVASQYSFVVYKLMAKMFGADFIEVPAKSGLRHDLTAMAKAIRPDTSVVFVTNPNNPTGTLATQREIDRFMAKVPEDVLVVFDEAYAEIAMGGMPDTAKFVKAGRACIVLRTFSKAYGLAGLRIGYGFGPQPLIESLQKPRQPFNTNRLAQIAACAALEDTNFVSKCRNIYRKGKKQVEAYCEEKGLEYVPAHANFILIKTGEGRALSAKLQAKGVIVRPMDGYGLAEWIRVTFGTLEQNQKFCEVLTSLI